MVVQVAKGITMVKPGFLENEDVIAWLGGVEPTWSYLEFGSYCRLQHRPNEDNRAMQLATDLTPAEVFASPIVGAMLYLLQMAKAKCAKLTPNGSLSRSAVAELAEIVDGPAFDLGLVRSVTKVLDERDVWPAELLRHVALKARLLRRTGKLLVPTTKGQKLLGMDGTGELMARLFEVVFWRINLAQWDGFPVPTWPQSDIGVIAWSLSHVATTWETPARLARLATVPVIGVLEAEEDFAGPALELRILRMLALFGLLDAERESNPANRFLPARRYRKTALFDRFFSFDVALEPIEGTRH
jgi:hypothetical protein